jgi:adenylate cyclase
VTPLEHREVAILAADVVGYSRLMEISEERTHKALMRLRTELFNPGISRDKGKVIKNTGDGFLAIFESAQDAMRCALSLQSAVVSQAAADPPSERLSFRMAVNQSSIIFDDGDIYGDGVNIASRLQAYAEPAGVVVTGDIVSQATSAFDIDAIDLGDLQLRNIARPIRAYALCQRGTRPRLIGDAQIDAEPRPSIAVLPFRKLLSRKEDRYFADGIVDDIVHALGALKELFVVSRSSTLAYRGHTIDARSIGRELGVRYVLYGSARRVGDQLRISTELSDAEHGDVISTEQYDGPLSELFAIQDQIATKVVNAIAPHVRKRELRRALRKHPQSMTAYDFVLQALDHLYRMNTQSFSLARTLLQQAISQDPENALAHTYTAFWYIFRVGEIGSNDPRSDALAAARHAAAAIELNEHDSLALAIFGHVQSFLLKDYERAKEILQRAVEAGPNSAMAWTMSSATAGFIGDGPAAIKRAERGVRLSPLDTYMFWHEGILAQAHFVNRDFEQALVWAQRACGRNESIRFTTRTLIASLAALGKKSEAAEIGHRLMKLQPEFRLALYAERCPFQAPVLDTWIGSLRSAGLPE